MLFYQNYISMKLSSINDKLYRRLLILRERIANTAMLVYDQWDDDGFGICDEIAESISDVLRENGIDCTDYGHDGDEHAAVVAYDDFESYLIDIPYYLYEVGGGYNWSKIPNVSITVDDVVIVKVDRPDWID